MTTKHQELAHAFKQLKTEAEIRAFLTDIATAQELAELTNRFQIAKTLWTTEKTYLEIAHQFKTSTTTVTRVATWLYKKKYGGYRTVLGRLYPKS
jgi:TrpR-related protein YerC/YecD